MVGLLSQLPITASGSALLGTGAGGAASILGGSDDASALFGNIGSTTNSIMTQIKANAEQRLADAKAQIDDVAQQRNDAINVQNERWISVKAQLNNAQVAVTNGQDSIQKISDTMLQMRISLGNAGTPGEDLNYWKDQYNSQVNSINIEADNGGPASNLIGNVSPVDFSPNSIEYRNDLGAGSTTIQGTYAGSTFRIEANDGTVWVPDPTTDIIQAYKAVQGEAQTYTTTDGQKIDKATSTRNGLHLVSYNAQTQQITVQISIVPTDPPLTVTGKLKTAGTGLMQSWFYNDFATAADRKRAFQDIDKGDVQLTSASADLQAAATQTTIDQHRIDNALNDLTQQTGKVYEDQQSQTQDLQIKAAQQYLAMQANLSNLSQQQNNYLQAFGGFIDDPFAQAALNLIA